MSPPPTRPEAYSRLSRRLVCVAGLAAILASQGCGSSAKHPNPQPNAERYVTGRIDSELGQVGPLLRKAAGTDPDVFVYCHPAEGGALLCNGTVTSATTHEPIAAQRWQVEPTSSGGVASARALDVQLIPQGAVAAQLARDHAQSLVGRPAPKPKPMATVFLAAARQAFPPTRTYACVDNGSGQILFEGVITGPKTVRVRAPRLRINLGNANLTLRVNGRIFRIPASPYGLAITPQRVSYLPRGTRPCNR